MKKPNLHPSIRNNQIFALLLVSNLEKPDMLVFLSNGGVDLLVI